MGPLQLVPQLHDRHMGYRLGKPVQPRSESPVLVDELTAWAHDDLLAAYRVLCLVHYWREHVAVQCARDQSSALQAVAMRWDPAARYPGPAMCHYAARSKGALRQVLSLVPPEDGCVIVAPNTDAHESLLALQPITRQPDEFLYALVGGEVPEALQSVDRISVVDAPSVGLREPWDWPSILGEPSTGRPIHCVIKDGQAVAVAAAGCPTALTEEVRGVWVAEAWRRQGLGRAVVASATADILARGRAATYETSADNLASQRLAESVGYSRVGSWLRLQYGQSRGAGDA